MPSSFRVVLAAGGTGGHIAPALALAEALERLDPACQITCICGMKPLESEMYARAGREPLLLDGRALQGKNPIQWVRGLGTGMLAVGRAIKILRDARPDVVVGMGGYAAAPVIFAAWLLRIPTYLHEQNAKAGRSNLALSRLARYTSAAHSSALDQMHGRLGEVIGNPLPTELFDATREDGYDAFSLDPERPVLLVLGGSQGAARLNDVVFETAQKLARRFPAEILPQFLWSTGDRQYSKWREKIEETPNLGDIFRVMPFIRDMPAAYACADLAIARSGAGTLAELTATGTPSLLVPYPHARDDHQTLNAAVLIERGGALMIRQEELTPDLLVEHIERLFCSPRLLLRMAIAADSLAERDAAERMGRVVLGLGNRRRELRLAREKKQGRLGLQAAMPSFGVTSEIVAPPEH